jgi:hypothetical protein
VIRKITIAIIIISFVFGCQSNVKKRKMEIEDWVPITLRARGLGVSPPTSNEAIAKRNAEVSAKKDAIEMLLEQVSEVSINDTETVGYFMSQDEKIRSRVEAYVKGAKVIEKKYNKDGSVEIEVEIVLGSKFREIFP